MTAKRNHVVAELRRGVITEDTLALVTRAAKALARARRVRPPSGGAGWTVDDVEDLVGDFLVDPTRLFALAATSTDDSMLTAGIQRAMQNLAIDRSRKGEHGVLRERIKRRCTKRPDVVAVKPEHWALKPFASRDHWGGGHGPLRAAAAATPVEASPTWSGNRSAPATTTRSLDAVCDAVFERARCPVHRADVVHVVAERILPSVTVDTLPADGSADPPATALPPDQELDVRADELAAEKLAERIWSELTDDDRTLLSELETPSRTLAEQRVLALGKSAVAARQTRLKTVLCDILSATPDPDVVFGHMYAWSRDHQRTGQPGGGDS